MKYKLIKRLYKFWLKVDISINSPIDDITQSLLKDIKYQVNRGIKGAETLLDWCREDFDIITKDNENYEELKNIWNICNMYLNYLNGQVEEKFLIYMIENY